MLSRFCVFASWLASENLPKSFSQIVQVEICGKECHYSEGHPSKVYDTSLLGGITLTSALSLSDYVFVLCSEEREWDECCWRVREHLLSSFGGCLAANFQRFQTFISFSF